jgi:hypothetical protein
VIGVASLPVVLTALVFREVLVLVNFAIVVRIVELDPSLGFVLCVHVIAQRCESSARVLHNTTHALSPPPALCPLRFTPRLVSTPPLWQKVKAAPQTDRELPVQVLPNLRVRSVA